MALKFTSVAYVILQVTKKKLHKEKKGSKEKKDTTEITESEPSKFGYLSIKYLNLSTYWFDFRPGPNIRFFSK